MSVLSSSTLAYYASHSAVATPLLMLTALLPAGDLKDEDKLLDWLMEMKDTTAEDVIEEVKGAQLKKMVEELDFLVVFFCKHSGTLITPSADSELLAAAVIHGL